MAKPEGDATGAARVTAEATAEAVKVATAKEAEAGKVATAKEATEAKEAKEAQREKDFGEHVKDGVEKLKAAQEKRDLQRRQDSAVAAREVPTRPEPTPRLPPLTETTFDALLT